MPTYDFTISDTGSLFEYLSFDVGNNGTDDTVNVTVLDTAGGVLVVISSTDYDFEIETVNFIIPAGWTYNLTSTSGYSPEYPYEDTNAYLYDADGNARGAVSAGANSVNISTACFTRGAMMLCADQQERPVETLKVGDAVQTMDRGAQKIRWIGSTRLTGETLEQFPNLRPIRIAANTLGTHRAQLVSPQHRMYVQSPKLRRKIDAAEALVPAKGLVNGTSVHVADDVGEVEYFHILFDRHEIIRADGAWSESFLPGAWMMSEMDQNCRDEVVSLFPALETEPEAYSPPARALLRVGQARQLSIA